MNAPPNIDPVTAHSGSDVVHWLTNDTRDERFIDNIFAATAAIGLVMDASANTASSGIGVSFVESSWPYPL